MEFFLSSWRLFQRSRKFSPVETDDALSYLQGSFTEPRKSSPLSLNLYFKGRFNIILLFTAWSSM